VGSPTITSSRRVTELDEEQNRIMLALELRKKDLKSLERVEITG
jgi:hypothetical protein